MSKFMKSTAAAVFSVSLLASPAAFAQAAASTGATDNAAAQTESGKVRQMQNGSASGEAMSKPAPAQSSGSTANAASQDENYKVRQKQSGGSKKKSKPMHSAKSSGGAPVPGTNTRN